MKETNGGAIPECAQGIQRYIRDNQKREDGNAEQISGDPQYAITHR